MTERTVTTTIEPTEYSDRDIDFISDMILEMISKRYGVVTNTLSFSIEVTFTTTDEEEETEEEG